MAKKTVKKSDVDAENEAVESELTDELTDEAGESTEAAETKEAPKAKKGKNIFYVHRIFALCRGNTYVNFTANQEIDFDTFSDEEKIILNALIKDGSLKRTPL